MRASLPATILMLLILSVGVGVAQDSGKLPWVVVRSRHADLTGASDQIVADFATETFAQADARRRNEKERDLAIVYQVMRRSAVGGRQPKLYGKGLKGYTQNIAAAYDRARRASAFLKEHTGELTRRAFDDINGLIRDYNNQYREALQAGTAPAGLSTVATVAPSEFRGKLIDGPPAIPGTWTTSSNSWEFGADGSFRIVGTRNRGEWKKTGDGIAIKYAGATVWIYLTFVGDTLVDQKGLIGRAQLRKRGG